MRYARDGFSVEAARKKGRPIPEDHWYHQKPTLPPGVDVFTEAFRDLTTCRPPDGAVPWTATMLWADRKGLPPHFADVLWSVIRRVDLAERVWRADDMKREHGGA